MPHPDLRRRLRRRITSSLVVLLLCGALAQPSRANSTASPVVASCASDRLPADILAGPIAAATATKAPATSAAATTPLRTIDVAAPGTMLGLAVADTERDREFGLMCVRHMRPRHGMIFVFSVESDQEFWMKNTLVPLDMIWVKADGDVTHVAANVPAVTLATPEASVPRRHGLGLYVIELPAGEASADGIGPSTHLEIPALVAR